MVYRKTSESNADRGFFMVRPRKHDKPPKRESPVQFRMEGDLGRLVCGFAERNGLGVNEAAKSLIALSAAALDCRYYGLVRQLADTLGGSNPFVQACLRVNASLEGAAMATGRPFLPEAERPAFVLRVVEGVLSDRGVSVRTDVLWFLNTTTAPAVSAPANTPTPEPTPEEVPVAKTRAPKVERHTKKRRSIRPGQY
jgi:hypothetical protein